MVTLSQSQTLPINPHSASPPLSLAQIWSALHLKLLKPELFVAPIASSEVLEETPTFIKRTITMKQDAGLPGGGGGKEVEEIQVRKPWKADFYNLTSHAFVNNTISQGKDATDLYLTYYFEWPHPELEEGSQAAKAMDEKMWGMAKGVVQHTIDVAREMVREGKL